MANNSGILLIGAGSWYYGQLLMNLVASIRAVSQIPVLIYTTNGCIDESSQKKLSSAKVNVKLLPDDLSKGNYLRPKLHIYDLSPFDKTLFLDADTIWLKKETPEMFMEKLSGTAFTCANEGHFDLVTGQDLTNKFYTLWADHQELMRAYQEKMKNRMYKLRSEVIYFEKGKEAKKLFAIAKKIYDAPKVNVIKSGAQVPDEFAFNLASSFTGIYPHEEKWCPAYWDFRMMAVYRRQSLEPNAIIHAFPILSIGGNHSKKQILKWYNDMSANNYKKMGWAGHRPLPNKSDILPSRKVM